MARYRSSSDPTSSAPRYREAYPYLDIGRAKAAFERGNIICEFTDRFDESLGIARFDLMGDRCQLEYNILAPFPEYISDWSEFELTPVRNGFEKCRVTIKCSGCDKQKKILLFKNKWRCAECHQLSFRSQLIHPLARKWETFDLLSEHLKHGKPHGIHNKTYIKLLDKLEALESKLCGQTRRYASCNFSRIVKAVWRAPLPDDDFFLPSLIAEAKFRKKDLPRGSSTQLLLSPYLPEPHSGHVLGGDYETDDPGQM